MREYFHRDLRGKIIGELAKDFSPHPLEDIASLIADAWRASGNGCRRKPVRRPVITRANNSKLLTTTTALDQPEPNARHRDRAADIHAVARLTPSAKDDNRKEKP